MTVPTVPQKSLIYILSRSIGFTFGDLAEIEAPKEIWS